MRCIQILGSVTFAAILAQLWGCDGEYERKQQISERNAKFWNACAAMGKERIVNEWRNGNLVCYAWDRRPGKHQTPAVVVSQEDL